MEKARAGRVLVSSHTAPTSAVASIGQAHYSYGIVQRGWLRALEAAGHEATVLRSPSTLYDPQWRERFTPGIERPHHLMIRNFRSLRPLPWARNIAVVAWEFDRITTDAEADPNPFRNQLGTLRACDEVWVASSYARDAIRDGGYASVHVVPGVPMVASLTEPGALASATAELLSAPSVTLGSGTGPSAAREEARPLGAALAGRAGPLFAAVLNPLDQRKDVTGLLQGFADFAATRPQATLLVKLALNPERHDLTAFIRETLPERVMRPFRPVTSANIILINAVLSDEAMSALYDRSDAFVSMTRAEGQNLPVQEAMLRRLPVIVPSHTAMADYIDEEVAFVLPADRVPVAPPFSPAYHLPRAANWYETDPAALTATLARFAAAGGDEIEVKTRAAYARIEARYGAAAVGAMIRERLDDRVRT